LAAAGDQNAKFNVETEEEIMVTNRIGKIPGIHHNDKFQFVRAMDAKKQILGFD